MTFHTPVARKTWLLLSLTLSFLLCCFASWRAGARASNQSLDKHLSPLAEQAGKGQALADALNADGRVKAGLAGSFDASGYRMGHTATGAPHFVPLQQGPNDRWDSQFTLPGTSGPVLAVASIGSDLYVGGDFNTVGKTAANNIAKWNGHDWEQLGNGLNSAVFAFAIIGNDLFVGGSFTTVDGTPANHIVRWSGSNWTPLGSGINGVVNTMAVSGGNLYVGGEFTMAGGNPANNLAKWDGNNWVPLGSGVTNGQVHALAFIGSDLYVAGEFFMAGGQVANNIAKWNGSSWAPLGSGVGDNLGLSEINALAVHGRDLYVGGDFRTAGGVSASGIAKWNGSNWAPLGSGVNTAIHTLAVNGDDLYVGGYFTRAGGNSISYIARWNGSDWAPLGSGINFSARACLVSNNGLFVGGDFTIAGGSPASRIAKWDGNRWLALGSGNGVSNGVNSFATIGSDLYVGGSFGGAGSIFANGVAKWDDNSWKSLGSGVDGSINALAVSGNDLYIGGLFTSVNGVPAGKIAKWDGRIWSALGVGLNVFGSEQIYALAAERSNLYVGGYFYASNITKWNGISWERLGSGLSSAVYALATSEADLYVGGYFGFSGFQPVTPIAKWDGSRWISLGNAPFGYVTAITVSGSDIYVGGGSTIAKWDGSSWTRLGSVSNGPYYVAVTALAVNGGDLYAGGAFNSVDGVTADNIARWNGGSWSSLGSGVNGTVNALAVMHHQLYVGGNFTVAGNKPSPYFGRYLLSALPTITSTTDLKRLAGTPASPSQIATVNDLDEAANLLTITINDAANATVNGVTITDLRVDTTGKVTATIAASVNALDATFTLRVRDTSGLFAEASLTVTITQPNLGPGAFAATTSPLNDQRPGSVLIYNVFTSSAAAPNAQNTRLSLTNTHPTLKSYIHLFFVDGATCSVADGFICLTPNQTASVLAADLDPGTSGYVVAVAVNATGCPVDFNYLIGDEFVKFSSGHAANLGAEAVTAIAGGVPLCDGNATTADLRFDGVSYSVLPHVLSADNIGSRADGNDTLLILNRLGGSLATGAATLTGLFGVLYDDAETPVSFSFSPGTCQFRSVISSSFPRTVPRFEQFIPAGRSGWFKVNASALAAMTGALINFNARATAQSSAFNQGHNLHKLTTTNTAVLTIPVFPPNC